jgi:hypothetical protein
VRFAVIVIGQESSVVQLAASPLQPVKLEPESGAAVRLTIELSGYVAEQVPAGWAPVTRLQSMRGVVPATVATLPEPEPCPVMVRPKFWSAGGVVMSLSPPHALNTMRPSIAAYNRIVPSKPDTYSVNSRQHGQLENFVACWASHSHDARLLLEQILDISVY